MRASTSTLWDAGMASCAALYSERCRGFATVRFRTKVTKGPGSRAAGLAMSNKLIESAQARWHAVNAPHLVALLRAGAKFEKGVMVERSEEHNKEVAA